MRRISVFLAFIIAFIPLFAQSNVNPDISAIGTFNTNTNFIKGSPDYGKLIFEQPSLELFIDGYLNPFAKAAGNLAYEDGEFSVEELYASIVRGLPLDMQIKAGKFLLGFGKLNTVHPHAWPFPDRPLFQQVYFGPEGLNDIGVNFSFILPTEDFYSGIDLGIYKGDGIGRSEAPDPESEESISEYRGRSPVFAGRLNGFFQIGDYDNLEVGLSASYGTHAVYNFNFTGDTNAARIGKPLNFLYTGIDFKYKYKPDAYTSLTLQGEAILNHRDVARESGIGINSMKDFSRTINTSGAFISLDYQFEKQFSAGLKYDYTYGIDGDIRSQVTLSNDDKNKTFGYSAWFGYYPVEETLAFRLGLQHLAFSYADGTSRDGETTITLQMIFSLGPHKAHPF